MLTYVSLQGSILKVLIKKLLVDNGNFNCLQGAKKQVTKYGLQDTFGSLD
jgi:hypothetical protein